MSLINEALKRARVEARRQEEEGRRDYNAVPAHARRPDRQRLLLVAGWSTAAVALGVVAWLSLGSGAEPPTPTSAAEAITTPSPGGSVDGIDGGADAPERPAATGQAETRIPTVESSVGEARTAEPIAVEADGQALSQAAETPPGRATGRSASTPSPRSVPPPSSAAGSRLEAGRTYLRVARSADGSTAELGGIAYSTRRPIAVINGSVVSNGDLIAGFTVVAVEPERVELEADGVRFFLALR